MNLPLTLILALTWLAILAMGWLGWQLLRQNGRLLLRLEKLEQQLSELEFGEGTGQPEGLPVGTEAPAFELPDLSGERKSLAQFRGQSVLLIFFNPDCGFCREMVPRLSTPLSEGRAPRVPDSSGVQEDQGVVELGPPTQVKPLIIIIATGDAEKNRQFFAGHKIRCPVLLQSDGEVAKAYQANGTPTGYLVSAEGKIASELAMGADALMALVTKPRSSRGDEAPSNIRNPKPETPENQSLLTSAATNGNENGRASRFGNRSLARSKLKRDGLKAGTPAPDFRLPRLDGHGDLSLDDLRGRRVLLVFSDPGCGPCNALAPELEKFHRLEGNASSFPCPGQENGFEHTTGTNEAVSSKVEVVMISRGEPKENRAKVKEHGLTFPIVLQQQWETSRRYAMFATPVAYLINEQGVIAREVAAGEESIRTLIEESRRQEAGASVGV